MALTEPMPAKQWQALNFSLKRLHALCTHDRILGPCKIYQGGLVSPAFTTITATHLFRSAHLIASSIIFVFISR